VHMHDIARQVYKGRALMAITTDANRHNGEAERPSKVALLAARKSLTEQSFTVTVLAEILGYCVVGESASQQEDMFSSVGVVCEWLEMELMEIIRGASVGPN